MNKYVTSNFCSLSMSIRWSPQPQPQPSDYAPKTNCHFLIYQLPSDALHSQYQNIISPRYWYLFVLVCQLHNASKWENRKRNDHKLENRKRSTIVQNCWWRACESDHAGFDMTLNAKIVHTFLNKPGHWRPGDQLAPFTLKKCIDVPVVMFFKTYRLHKRNIYLCLLFRSPVLLFWVGFVHLWLRLSPWLH